MERPTLFDPPALPDLANAIKALRVLPVPELSAILWQIRRAELAAGAIEASFLAETRRTFLDGLSQWGLGRSDSRERLADQHLATIVDESALAATYMVTVMDSDEFFNEYVIWHGRQHLDHATSAGHGAVLVQAHWGPFQLLFPALVCSGYPTLQAFGEPPAADWAKSLFHEFRPKSELDAHVTAIGRDMVVRHALRALAKNQFFCIPFEVSTGAKPTFRARLLGHEVTAPEGPYLIAAHAKAPVMAVFLELDGPYMHIHVTDPVAVPSRAPEHIQAAIDHVYARFGSMLADKPYMWRGWHFLEEIVPQAAERG